MDNFIVSARKYRPATFDSVVGQKSITSTLQNAIRTNTLAQAFLFCGPRGVGKTTCARIMAKTINCLHPTAEIEACNECESCKSFNDAVSFNIYELDAASNNSVDDIRNLVDQVRIPPQIGKYKVYIIDEVHMLSAAAFNAFLKTLEEPPAYAKFILATTEKHKILPTILSRCQIFDFKRITVDDITEHLRNISKKEGIEAEDEALNIIAQKADGALRDALSIFDQMVSFSGNKITYKDVIANLNVLDYEYYFRLTDYILVSNINAILLLLNEIVDNGFDPQHFIQGFASHLRNLLLGKDESTIQLMEISQQLRNRYLEQSRSCSHSFLIKALTSVNQCDLDYRSSSNKRLHIEICLLNLCNIEDTPQIIKQVQPISQPVVTIQDKDSTQPQTPTPSKAVSQAQPVQAPAAVQPSLATEKKEVPKEPEKNVTVGRLRKNSTISILETEKKNEDKPVVEEIWDTPFTQEQLLTAWLGFIETYRNVSPSFTAGISKYKPVLAGNSEIHYDIDNILVVKDIQGMHALQEHLKKTLHNNVFKLVEKVVEKPVDVMPYTDRDKFESMAERNPNLRTLKDTLNLEIDI